MSELVTKDHFTAASFINDSSERTYPAEKYILGLIVASIKNEAPITREAMLNAYLDSTAFGGSQIKITHTYKREPFFNVHTEKIDYRFVVDKEVFWTKEEWLEKEQKRGCNMRSKSLQWFKQNLGAAIIRGKILALPIIEI